MDVQQSGRSVSELCPEDIRQNNPKDLRNENSSGKPSIDTVFKLFRAIRIFQKLVLHLDRKHWFRPTAMQLQPT
jgi:hypothetical protein